MKGIALNIALAGLVAVAAPLTAQGKERKSDSVPAGFRPPAGMCRIWVTGVPAGQQPAPTDCATAVRNRPANGRVLFGDDYAKLGSAPRSDDAASDEPGCIDRNRDGTCDFQVRQQKLPSTLPQMVGAVLIERGRRTEDVSGWLGSGVLQARYVDRDRNGIPERVSWLNEAGEVLQVWIDSDTDGRADSVEVYEGGKKVRTVGPS